MAIEQRPAFLGSGSLTSANGSNSDVCPSRSYRCPLIRGGSPSVRSSRSSLPCRDPTALVIAAQADEDATVALRAACAQQPLPDGRSSQLQVAVADNGDVSWPAPSSGSQTDCHCRRRRRPTPHVVDAFRVPTPLCSGFRLVPATPCNWPGSQSALPLTSQQIDGILVADPDPEEPNDWPCAAASPTGTPKNADAPDGHSDGDETVNDGDQTSRASC